MCVFLSLPLSHRVRRPECRQKVFQARELVRALRDGVGDRGAERVDLARPHVHPAVDGREDLGLGRRLQQEPAYDRQRDRVERALQRRLEVITVELHGARADGREHLVPQLQHFRPLPPGRREDRGDRAAGQPPERRRARDLRRQDFAVLEPLDDAEVEGEEEAAPLEGEGERGLGHEGPVGARLRGRVPDAKLGVVDGAEFGLFCV